MSNPFHTIEDALQLGTSGSSPRPADIVDGDTFVLDDGQNPSRTFEFNKSGGTAAGTIAEPDGVATPDEVATAVVNAIVSVTGSFNIDAATDPADAHVVTLTVLAPSDEASAVVDLSGTPALLSAPNLVRIVGNRGVAGDPTGVKPYSVGWQDNGQPLEDGGKFDVPQGVTVMVDAGGCLRCGT